MHNVSYARHDAQMRDINYDGIHLRKGGYATFLQRMHDTICSTINRYQSPCTPHFPSVMIPPLVKVKSQKEKMKEEQKEKNINIHIYIHTTSIYDAPFPGGSKRLQ